MSRGRKEERREGREKREEEGENRNDRCPSTSSSPPSLKKKNENSSGLDNSGKTTATAALTGGDTSAVAPTLGFQIRSLRHERTGTSLNLWDVGGQRTLRPFWRNYFEKTDGLVWVVDASDGARLRDCALELRRLLAEERLAGAPLLVLANKQDVRGALGPGEVARALGLEGAAGGEREEQGGERAGSGEAALDSSPSHPVSSLASDRPWKVAGISALQKEGVREAFDWLAGEMATAALGGKS